MPESCWTLRESRSTRKTGRPVAAAEAGHANRLAASSEVCSAAVRQVGQPRQELGVLERGEPLEVLVVGLDEHGRTRCGAALGERPREVAGALVVAGSAIDTVGIRPHTEVAHVQHVLEAHAENRFESADVVVQAIEGAMDVAGCADDHGSLTGSAPCPR